MITTIKVWCDKCTHTFVGDAVYNRKDDDILTILARDDDGTFSKEQACFLPGTWQVVTMSTTDHAKKEGMS